MTLLGHLSFVGTRPAATACIVCRQDFDAEPFSPPGCERCGLDEPLYHFRCYVQAIARGATEAAFWASEDPAADARVAIFLCPGCRS